MVWNYEEVEPELGQATLLDRVRSLLGLALAGRSRQRALEHAAATDPLTGLGNRRAFDVASNKFLGTPAVDVSDLRASEQTVRLVVGGVLGDEQVGFRYLMVVGAGS